MSAGEFERDAALAVFRIRDRSGTWESSAYSGQEENQVGDKWE
ncbi:hypothetical protein ACFL1S_04070 [Pseudomonadota bacterium]